LQSGRKTAGEAFKRPARRLFSRAALGHIQAATSSGWRHGGSQAAGAPNYLRIDLVFKAAPAHIQRVAIDATDEQQGGFQMTSTLHSTAAMTFLPMLANLSHVLSKAEAFAAERRIDPSVLLNDRLAPDMLPFIAQVNIACDHAKSSLYRLQNVAPPSVADDQKTFADLQARIDRTIELFNAVPASAVNGRENEIVEVKSRAGALHFTGLGYLLGYAFPNFYFHVTTAYNILRHNGVPLGKMDFLNDRSHVVKAA
jgi:uncharacterized protein